MITGGSLDMDFARIYLQKEHFDKVIAVDGGLAAAQGLSLTPDYIVGDLDTVDPGIVERYRQIPYIVWDCHRPEKNETDTELARSRAVTLSCGRLVFLGATGGRIDHMLGNLHALYICMQKGLDACLVDAQNRVRLIDGAMSFRRAGQWGKYISFLPYTEEVTGITLTGFKYPLAEKTIRRGYEVGLCISNEIVEEQAEITFTDGVLVCIESRD